MKESSSPRSSRLIRQSGVALRVARGGRGEEGDECAGAASVGKLGVLVDSPLFLDDADVDPRAASAV